MRGLLANGVSMLAARLLPPVFAFAVHLGVARLGGAASLGAYVHVLAVLMIFQAIAAAGMQFLLVREIAAAPGAQADVLRRGRGLGLATGTLATVAYLAYAFVMLPDDLTVPAVVLAATLVPTSWITVHEAAFIAAHRHHRIAVVAVVENAIKMGGALTALLSGYGLTGICVAIAVARLGGSGVGLVMLRRDGLPIGSITFAGLQDSARAVLPFALLFAVSMAYFRIDVPIVGAVTGSPVATGWYGAAATLFLSVLLLPESAMAAAYPRLAAAYATPTGGYGAATALVARLLVLGIAPVALSLILLAEPLVQVIYGDRFAESAAVLRLLALSLPIHALNGALGQALQAARAQDAMLRIVTGGLALHVLATTVFVRWFGIEGAAIALLCSSTAVALGALRAVQQRLALPGITVRGLLQIVPVAGPLFLASSATDAWRPAVAACAIAWLAVGVWWSGLVASSDLHVLRGALRGPTARQA